MPITKEQVEAEGWKASQYFDKAFMRYDKEWCYGLWLLKDNKIHISKSKPEPQPKGETHILYEGECKSIDKFREICKSCNLGKQVDINIAFTQQSNS
jgi:hypothetical protein